MANKKADKAAPAPKPTGHPRNWTKEQCREAFLKGRSGDKDDYQVIKKGYQEELIPYGHLVYDHVLGLKGIARHGRVTQIHGDEGAGKSTNTYYIASQYQKFTEGPIAIFDFEATATGRSADRPYLETLGIDMDMCLLKQPSSVEKAIQDTVDLIREQGVRMFIYDSIPRMQSMVDYKDIKSKKAFKASYGKHAQTMANFYRCLIPYFIEYDCGMLIVNQTRDRMDGDDYTDKFSYTNKDYQLPGGRICRFTPSVMIELRLDRVITGIKDTDSKTDRFLWESAQVVGHESPIINRVRIRTLKSKVTGAGFRQGYIYIRPGSGVDENISIRELAREYGLINFSGKWYCGASKEEAFVTFSSKEEAIDELVVKQNPAILAKLKELVCEAIDHDTTRHAFTADERDIALAEGTDIATQDMDFEAEEL